MRTFFTVEGGDSEFANFTLPTLKAFFLNMSDKAGYLLALDYCKAFDSISKDLIIEAFKLFRFGEQFTKWVKTLF